MVEKLGIEPVALESVGNETRLLSNNCDGLLGVLLGDGPGVAIVGQGGVDNQVFATEGQWEAAVGSARVWQCEGGANEAVLSFVHHQVDRLCVACPQHVVLGAVGSNVGVNNGRAGGRQGSTLDGEQSDVVVVYFATQEWHLEDAGGLGSDNPQHAAFFFIHHVAFNKAEEVATAILGLEVGKDVAFNIDGVIQCADGENLHHNGVGHEVAGPAVVDAGNDVAHIVDGNCGPAGSGASLTRGYQ